tara:strand:+ start:114 stop:281 length:168 start_codon:yes stop_codon:yes gene_type:complete
MCERGTSERELGASEITLRSKRDARRVLASEAHTTGEEKIFYSSLAFAVMSVAKS